MQIGPQAPTAGNAATRGDPRHVAIIMDGNGRWAQQRRLPRGAGHRRGVEAVRAVVRACHARATEYLTLFAFSSENWQRPADEVSSLMQLFVSALEAEMPGLHDSGVRFRMIGERSRFEPRLVGLVERCERLTRDNARLTLTVAANYGGRWDIMQALNRLLADRAPVSAPITERDLAPYLALHGVPDPDLFIRTGGEQRISNFLLWQLAYTELYFTDTLWPDFDESALEEAYSAYRRRERRYGRISEDASAVVPAGAPPRRVAG